MPKKKPVKSRQLLPVFHIYCEGAKTEPNYIEKYLQIKSNGDRRKQVVKVEPTKKNTPVQLVDEAVSHKNRSTCPDNDVFWVVFDRESIAKYPDALHEAAFNKAATNNVNIALSNVCFELWILLHFIQNAAPFTSYDNLMSDSGLKQQLQIAGIRNYEKGNAGIFRAVFNGLDQARARAVIMNSVTKGSAAPNKNKPYQLNPYTDVYKLLDAIDDFV